MAFCPFMSNKDSKVDCSKDCQLYVKSACIFNLPGKDDAKAKAVYETDRNLFNSGAKTASSFK